MRYTEKEINDLLEKVYSGEIDIENLPKDLYNRISNYLISGLGKIEGKISDKMISELSYNLQYFSGAKIYQQIKEMSLIKDQKEIKSFSEFKEEAIQVFDQYNVNWLRTEYDTTIGQAQMVERWEQIEDQKKSLPFLKYSAIVDASTSDICLPLDGVCLPVDDAFWDTNSPLNHFNCRCTLEQLDKEDATVTPKKEANAISKEMEEKRQPLFNSNPYKDKAIFDASHPYFDLDKQGHKAVNDLIDDGE